jgi:hypothetical protein
MVSITRPRTGQLWWQGRPQISLKRRETSFFPIYFAQFGAIPAIKSV